MSRFERGDEVVTLKHGEQGIVTNAPFEDACWVRFEGEETPTYVADYAIRLTIEKPKEWATGGYVPGDTIPAFLPDNSYIVSEERAREIFGANPKVVSDMSLVGAKVEVEVNDPVKHPSHYTSDPSGVECLQITRHRNFAIGNAIKYLWRAGLKTVEGKSAIDKQVEDLRKAIFYIEDEIKRLEQGT